MDPSQDDKGNYALYSDGKLLGYSGVTMIQGKKIVNKYVVPLNTLIQAAAKDKVTLMIDSGFRTWNEQFNIRKNNLIDRTKVNDRNYIITADAGLFSPRTAKPGFSNHQDGDAVDFNVNYPGVYKWMVHNALQHGWIRTVPSETWHWQYLPGTGKFQYVPQNHPSWAGLV